MSPRRDACVHQRTLANKKIDRLSRELANEITKTSYEKGIKRSLQTKRPEGRQRKEGKRAERTAANPINVAPCPTRTQSSTNWSELP